MALKGEAIDVTLSTGGKELLFVLRPRYGAPIANEPVRFSVTAPEPTAEMPATDVARVRAALVARLNAREGDFRWQEVRARTTLHEADPKWDAEVARIADLLPEHQAEAVTGLDALRQRRPAEKMNAFQAWDLGLLLLRIGEKEAANGYFRRVVAVLEDARRKGPVPSPVWERGAAAHVALGDAAAGRADLAACVQLKSGEKGSCTTWHMASLAEARGDIKEASALYDEALGDGTTASVTQLIRRAALAARAGDGAAELTWARRAFDQFSKEAQALETLASAEFRAGHFEAAVRHYDALFQLAPTRPGVLAHLSGAFNRFEGAVRTGGGDAAAVTRLREEMAARAAQGDVVGRFVEAVAAFYEGRFDAAVPAFHALEQDVPGEARLYIYQAMAHHWQGHAELAEPLALKAVAVGPDDPDVWYCRSQIFRSKNRPQAIGDLKRYMALSEQPGAIHFTDKTERIRKELAMLEAGEMPPDWDRPRASVGGFFGLHGDAVWILALALIGVFVLVQIGSVRRRRGALARRAQSQAELARARAEARAAGIDPDAIDPDSVG